MFQLFPGLQPQALDGGVVRFRRQGVALHPPEFLHFLELPLDVALIFDGNLDLFRRFRGQAGKIRVKPPQVLIPHLGPPEQGNQRRAIADRGGAPLYEESVQFL